MPLWTQCAHAAHFLFDGPAASLDVPEHGNRSTRVEQLGDGGAGLRACALASPLKAGSPERDSANSDIGGVIGARIDKITVAALIAAAAILATLYGGSRLVFTASASGAQVAVPVASKCHTVTARTYNKRVRVLREITGDNTRGTLVKRKVCKHKRYAALLRTIKRERADCLRKTRRTNGHDNAGTTGASFYSYGDSGGLTGACGTFLPNPAADYSFAILSSGNVTSRCGQSFYFHRHGVTRWGFQADTGGGGGEADGLARTFDFWNAASNPTGKHRPGLAHDLKLTRDGLGRVQYSRNNCWAR